MDGSKTTDKGRGAGIFGRGTKYSEPIAIDPSVFQAEIRGFKNEWMNEDPI